MRLRLFGLIAALLVGWACYQIGTRYDSCMATLRADNAKLDTIGAAIDSRLARLSALLGAGPLPPDNHEIEHILDEGDYAAEGFGTLGSWIDPSIQAPSWNGENTPVPTGLSPELAFRTKLTEFSNIWLQAQIIAVHLAMRNDPDIALAHAHQTGLLRQINWLMALPNARPTISARHCVRRGLGVD